MFVASVMLTMAVHDMPNPSKMPDVSNELKIVRVLDSYNLDTSGLTFTVTDDKELNCGGKGGGCTTHYDRPLIAISPSAFNWDEGAEHVILHEYAHAKFNATECEAEAYAQKISGAHDVWSYPSCAKGIEPKG